MEAGEGDGEKKEGEWRGVGLEEEKIMREGSRSETNRSKENKEEG